MAMPWTEMPYAASCFVAIAGASQETAKKTASMPVAVMEAAMRKNLRRAFCMLSFPPERFAQT